MTQDILKSILTLGIGKVLGTNTLTNEIYNPTAKVISSVVDIIDHLSSSLI